MADQTKTGLGIDEIIGDKRDAIIQLARQYHATNVRVFGSVARGEARPDSDVDFLVEFQPGTRIWDMIALWQELKKLMGREVNLSSDDNLRDDFRRYILRDAVPL